MNEIIVDGMLHGTGIRDKIEGGYIYPRDIGLSNILANKIRLWLLDYESEHYNNFSSIDRIKVLDSEGIKIAQEIKAELSNTKVFYYSNAKLELFKT